MSQSRSRIVMASMVLLVSATITLGLSLTTALAQTSATNSTTTSANTTSTATNTTTTTSGNSTGGNLTAQVSIVSGAATLKDKAFSPNPLNITVGTNVTWTNNDNQIHTVTSGNGSSDPNMGKQFDSGLTGATALKAQGSTFSHVFTTPGTYQYFCQVHPTMVGTVIVSSGTSAVPEFPTSAVLIGATVALLGGAVLMTRFKTGGTGLQL